MFGPRVFLHPIERRPGQVVIGFHDLASAFFPKPRQRTATQRPTRLEERVRKTFSRSAASRDFRQARVLRPFGPCGYRAVRRSYRTHRKPASRKPFSHMLPQRVGPVFLNPGSSFRTGSVEGRAFLSVRSSSTRDDTVPCERQRPTLARAGAALAAASHQGGGIKT